MRAFWSVGRRDKFSSVFVLQRFGRGLPAVGRLMGGAVLRYVPKVVQLTVDLESGGYNLWHVVSGQYR